MLPCVCSATENSRRQNVIGTSVTYPATPRVPLSSPYHVFTSSAICYWTEVRKHGIYLLIQILFNCEKRHTWQMLRSTWSHVPLRTSTVRNLLRFPSVRSLQPRAGMAWSSSKPGDTFIQFTCSALKIPDSSLISLSLSSQVHRFKIFAYFFQLNLFEALTVNLDPFSQYEKFFS